MITWSLIKHARLLQQAKLNCCGTRAVDVQNYTVIKKIHWNTFLNGFLLALACGPNSHFNACSSDCPATCSRLDAPEGCGSCEESCECNEGFLLSGGTCVTSDDCGCWVEGQHYEVYMGWCKKVKSRHKNRLRVSSRKLTSDGRVLPTVYYTYITFIRQSFKDS